MPTSNIPENYIEIATVSDIPDKKPLCTSANGMAIAISRAKGEYYAVENVCSHAASTFEGGKIKSHFLICPLHGVLFDMKTGQPRGNLTKKPLKTYELMVSDDKIFVRLADES